MINKPAALIAISFSFCNSTKVSNFIVLSLEVGTFGFILMCEKQVLFNIYELLMNFRW